MTDGPLAQSQSKAPTRDETSRRSHPMPGCNEHRTWIVACQRGIGGWPKRVQDCLVANHAPSAARQSGGCRIEHTTDQRPIENKLTASHEAGLDQRRSVERSRGATHRGRETVSDRSQELAGTGL